MSINTQRKTSKSTKPIKVKQEPVDPLHQNIFASPWKKSDTILVADNEEFHVHRSILTMHSPVFDAMFGGNFREANEERVRLPGKDTDDMLQFLKLLYPESMISTPKISFKRGNEIMKFSVLRIADEYQAEELVRKCLKKIKISNSNVLEILPYANKYNHNVRKKCVRRVAKHVRLKSLEECFTKLEAPLIQELLVEKCRYYESCLLECKHNDTTGVRVIRTTQSRDGSSDEESEEELEED